MNKIKIEKKECDYRKIILSLDKKQYLKFIDDILPLCQIAEKNSNPKNLKYTLMLNGIKTPDMLTGGWANRCEDFKFVLFLDFDNHAWWQVQVQLEMLTERFNLSPFYVFQTENLNKKDFQGDEYGSYNCVCLTKQRFTDIFKIQDETTCDQAHKHLPRVYHFHSSILRQKSKGSKKSPTFRCVVGDLNKTYDQPISSAHLKFLENVYPVPKIKYSNPDGFESLWLADYSTSSK